MKLSELIAAIGDDKVEIQNLDQCITDMRLGKGGNKFTFGTMQPFDFDGPAKFGMILWLPRDDLKAALAGQPRKE